MKSMYGNDENLLKVIHFLKCIQMMKYDEATNEQQKEKNSKKVCAKKKEK